MTRMEIESRENDDSLSRYNFHLPESLIAQEPAQKRSSSRCIFTRRGTDERQTGQFSEIVDHLRGDELLIYNDTKVIPARIRGNRASGGKVEIFLLRPSRDGRTWIAWISPSKRIKSGEVIQGSDVDITVHGREGSSWRIEWPQEIPLEAIGEVPLPPYIHRDSSQQEQIEKDRERYQTVFATNPGAVAAPTAGLHFDEEVLRSLENLGVDRAPVTLHVGPGTFKPIESDDLSSHKVDPEWFSVPAESRDKLHHASKQGRPIIAVGTTSLRVLESLEDLTPGQDIFGETELTILPGYQFRHVDGLLTNFHLPGSSLLVLVSCFHGLDHTLDIYRHAIEDNFRFYSYGDCMLIMPGGS